MPIDQETLALALEQWGLTGSELSLVAQRENIVFDVRAAGAKRYALRFHRPGYQTVQMMKSELSWVQHLKSCGLNVPSPIPSKAGAILVANNGYHVDLLSWLPGHPMGKTGTPLKLADRTGTFRKTGSLMAHMHRISDEWEKPKEFARQEWNLRGLLGETPLWGRFWENPGLNTTERKTIIAARDKLRDELSESDLDYGLIHADMLRENVMINGGEIGLIDFDDSGFGYRLFDVATALFKNRSEPDYEDLKTAFLEGYRSVRPLDTKMLSQMTLVRALSYLGWIIPRFSEPGSEVRQQRFLCTALPMAQRYLG